MIMNLLSGKHRSAMKLRSVGCCSLAVLGPTGFDSFLLRNFSHFPAYCKPRDISRQIEWTLIPAYFRTCQGSVRIWNLAFEIVKGNLVWYKIKLTFLRKILCWIKVKVSISLVLTAMAQSSVIILLGMIIIIFSQDLLRYADRRVNEHIRNNERPHITLHSFISSVLQILVSDFITRFVLLMPPSMPLWIIILSPSLQSFYTSEKMWRFVILLGAEERRMWEGREYVCLSLQCRGLCLILALVDRVFYFVSI